MNVLGVCVGNGVMVYPFKKELILNLEPRSIYSTPGEIQWKLNFKVPKVKNLLIPKKVDVLMGHPDCGHSSMMSLTRIKKFTDPNDNHSLNVFFRAIDIYKPKIWLLENLPKLLETIPLSEFKTRFPEYTFFHHIGPVSDFGNSQIHRKRLIIIGIKKKYRGYKKFISVYQVNTLKKSGQLIEGINECEKITEPITDTITLYAGFKITLGEAKSKWVNEFSKKTRWPVEGRRFKTAPGVYKNLENGYPATARKQNRQFNHLGEQMSARELARIQGVPDEFAIWMDESKLKTCINKGRTTVTKCPPYEVGVWFYEIIKLLEKEGLFTRTRARNRKQ